ncbi:MAG: phosphopentomutase [Pseudomonadota bacterium]|nr:phosphopentomutase [Pseudomonadota bacterium]
MARVIVLLMDSFGVGAASDADRYGDVGADTFGHIAQWCAENKADRGGVRQGSLHIPNLLKLGLAHLSASSTQHAVVGLPTTGVPQSHYGYAVETSMGKDTPSGHWEIAGVPVMFEWGYFPPDYPSFSESLLAELIARCDLPGVLGNCHASGTEIIEEFGELHQQTGKPIVYTSADSVFQVAAHEQSFGLEKLYEVCAVARVLVDPYNIGRVIARPFVGVPGAYERTGNRRDISMPPPEPTLLDHLIAEEGQVIAIGKTADIFAHQGISTTIKADGLMSLFDATLAALAEAPTKSLIFTNFVDFDSHYGHRRDVVGYAHALEEFDRRLPELQAILAEDDIVIMTADHGCDPTWPGSDHTREHIPVIAFGPGLQSKDIGRRETFADIGQSIAKHLGLRALSRGTTFL